MPDRHDNLISVMIPAFNAGETLRETLDSVSNQTHRPIEVIFVNDGSTDGTLSIFDSWKARYADQNIMTVCINQDNSGLLVSRQVGLERSSGRYLQFLDADDILHPQKLERSLSVMQQTNSDVVVSRTRKFKDRSEISQYLDNKPSVWPWSKKELSGMTITSGYWHSIGPLFKRECVENAGQFPKNLNPVAEELEFHGRIKLSKPRIAFIDELLNFYRVGRCESVTGSLTKLYAGRIDGAEIAQQLLKARGVRSAKEWRSLIRMALQTHYQVVNCANDPTLSKRSWKSLHMLLQHWHPTTRFVTPFIPRYLADWCCRSVYRRRNATAGATRSNAAG